MNKIISPNDPEARKILDQWWAKVDGIVGAIDPEQKTAMEIAVLEAATGLNGIENDTIRLPEIVVEQGFWGFNLVEDEQGSICD